MEKLTESLIQNVLQSEFEGSYEWVIPNYTPPNWWECDVMIISKAGYAQEFEIKISRADFKTDFKKAKGGGMFGGHEKKKHAQLTLGDHWGPKHFWYVCPDGILTLDDIPEYAGLRYIRYYDNRRPAFWKTSVIKKAPTLHREKFPQAAIEKMGRMFYYRLWAGRRKINKLSNELNNINEEVRVMAELTAKEDL